MSKIISKESEKVVYKEVHKLEGIKCDYCNAIIPAVADPFTCKYPQYYDVLTGHRDWGNDSCESMEWHDICPDCINAFVSEYLSNIGYSTKYIEIEEKYVCPVKVDKDGDEV